MKKRMALLLSAALMLSLTACGGGTESEEADGSGSTSSSATESTNGMLVVGEPYATGAFDITVTGFDFTEQAENPNGDGDLVPGDGYITANVYYTVKYTGKAAASGTLFQPAVLK